MKKSELNLTDLPLKELLKRTFSYVWNDNKIWLQILLITIAFVAMQAMISLIPFCSDYQCSEKWQTNISNTFFMIVNAMIIICYCRKIILKKTTDIRTKNFWKAVLFYCIAAILVVLALIIPVVLSGVLFGLVFGLSDDLWIPLFIVAMLILFSIFLSPLLLMFPSISVEDYKMINIKKLFKLTSNCRGKIFWGMFLAMMPCSLILLALAIIYSSVYGSEALGESIAMPVVAMLLQLVNTYIKGSFYSHLYQFFKFIDKE